MYHLVVDFDCIKLIYIQSKRQMKLARILVGYEDLPKLQAQNSQSANFKPKIK